MAYLGVTESLTGRQWIGPSIETDRLAQAITQQTGLPAPLCQSLARLGVTTSDAEQYLDPKLRDLLPDPRSLRDMEKAASRFIQAVTDREKIAIFADYDVDGGSSAALLIDWLRQMGHTATLYVPDRVDEGYGPNKAAMTTLSAEHDLIICVDCGTLSHAPLESVTDADVIILDHHLGGETLPKAVAVVNPNRQDETRELTHLCAAAVVFLMLVEVRRQLRDAGTQSPDLMSMLDLVALATVADVAPLTGVNRAFVRQGLRTMAKRKRPGLCALADVAQLDTVPAAYHLGFVLGPRINAGGRVGRADLGARLLATDNMDEATAIAERLNQLNSERREIEEAVRAAATEQATKRGLDAPLIWAAGDGWHPGVVGIVASRLKEMANRPAVVIGFDEGEGKGSGRSITGVDLGASIQRLTAEGTITKGGGHKMAAGLSLTRDQLEPAMDRLSELLAKQGAGTDGAADLKLDGIIMPGAATIELVHQLESAGPFGAAAPAPRFAFADMHILFTRQVGESHLKLRIGDTGGTQLDAIYFNAFENPIGNILLNHDGARFHFSGRLDINRWRGRETVQLRIEDAAHAT